MQGNFNVMESDSRDDEWFSRKSSSSGVTDAVTVSMRLNHWGVQCLTAGNSLSLKVYIKGLDLVVETMCFR